jgi:hypothetical protein
MMSRLDILLHSILADLALARKPEGGLERAM